MRWSTLGCKASPFLDTLPPFSLVSFSSLSLLSFSSSLPLVAFEAFSFVFFQHPPPPVSPERDGEMVVGHWELGPFMIIVSVCSIFGSLLSLPPLSLSSGCKICNLHPGFALLCLGCWVVCLICCWFCFSHTRERKKGCCWGHGVCSLCPHGLVTPKLGLVTWISRWMR